MARPRKNYANPDSEPQTLGEFADGERVILDPHGVRATQLAEQDELEELDDQEDGELGRVIDEIRSSGAVRLLITRTLPDMPGKKGYCGEMTTAEFTQEAVRRRYGPGRYRIRCMGTKGLVRGGGTIDIADTTLPEGSAGPGSVEEMLSLMEKREEARRAAANDTRLQYMQILAPVMGPIIAAMVGNKGPDITALIAATRGPSLSDVTQTMANLKQMQGGEESKLESFIKMLEVAKEVTGNGKGGGETNWLDVLKEGLGMARPALEGLIQNAANRVPSPPMLQVAPAQSVSTSVLSSPATSQAISTENSGVTGDDPMLRLLPWLKGQLEFLIVKAARDSDPELYAELLVDNVPDGVKPEKILEMLKREDWWKMLTMFSPGVTPYVGWFTQLRDAVIQLIQGPDESTRENQGHSAEDETGPDSV